MEKHTVSLPKNIAVFIAKLQHELPFLIETVETCSPEVSHWGHLNKSSAQQTPMGAKLKWRLCLQEECLPKLSMEPLLLAAA